MNCRCGHEVFSYTATGFPPLLPLNHFLLILKSGAAISSLATAFPYFSFT